MRGESHSGRFCATFVRRTSDCPSLQLRHVFGEDTRGTKPVFNLSPLLTSIDGSIIAASARFWAVPWVGGGGPVYVSPLSASGKVGGDASQLYSRHMTKKGLAFIVYYTKAGSAGN